MTPLPLLAGRVWWNGRGRHGILRPHIHFHCTDIAVKTFGRIQGAMAGDHKCMHDVMGDDALHFQPCGKVVLLYRTCGIKNDCKVEVAYCDEHGGDDRMMKEMQEHMQTHKEKK